MAERGSEPWTQLQRRCSATLLHSFPTVPDENAGVSAHYGCERETGGHVRGPGLGRQSSGSYSDFTVLPDRLHQPRLGKLLSLTKPPFSPLEHGHDNSKCVPTVNLTLDWHRVNMQKDCEV